MSGPIRWRIRGALAFVGIDNRTGGAECMQGLSSGRGLGASGTIFLMLAILVVLGTFMEWIAIIFITVPIFAPVVVGMTPELAAEFGMATCSAELRTGCLDEYWVAVWFGVLFVMNIQIYFLSPPFGPAAFYLKSVAPPHISLTDIFKGFLPFICIQLLALTVMLVWPNIITLLL